MDKSKSVSIEWESSGYSVLKNLKATIEGMFTEFIDNSIQSYKNDKEEIKRVEPTYSLKISIKKIGDEIIIRDNAGGINEKNFDRALKPANKADDTSGLHEFGLGMKYAAVWISNEWELISSAFGEDVERKVVFNYHDVTKNNKKTLPISQKKVDKNTHYTIVKLRELEPNHIKGWKKKICAKKLASVYRNFLRENKGIYSDYCEDKVEINWDMDGDGGTNLVWEDYGFLNAKWYKDVEMQIDTKPVEWCLKLQPEEIPTKEYVITESGERKEQESNITVSGFIGILPQMEKEKNGFVLLRRGRVVEGINSRVFPVKICGAQVGSPKYKRIYGEIHFTNTKVSFDKSQLSISPETRDLIFEVIATKLKKSSFGSDSRMYNLISQAQEHRLSDDGAKKKLEKALKTTRKNEKTLEEDFKDKKADETLIDEGYLQLEKELNEIFVEKTKGELPKIPSESIEVSGDSWELIINNTDFSEAVSESNKLYTTEARHDEKKLYVSINESHEVFHNKKYNDDAISLLVNTIATMAISELHADQGGGKPKHVRYKFNDFSHRLNRSNK